jgi:membrane-anchored mycosin MYCP
MVRMRVWAAATALVALSTMMVLVRPAPAAADGPCGSDQARPGQPVRDIPWQQKLLAPERVWPFATGRRQVVAIVDTGTDGTHPQLAGHIQPGFDLIRNVADNNLDCSGHGTGLASLIVAQRADGVGFLGMAPDATIMPVRVTDADPASDPSNTKLPTTATVAKAVDVAREHGATVIDVSIAFTTDDPALRDAVLRALAAGITVVAPVGDQHDPQYAEDPPRYPAAYPGVIGVGSIEENLSRNGRSNVGRAVLVTAPGQDVVGAAVIAGNQKHNGTSVAAAIVAGTAALVRQAWPQLSAEQVARRIELTADPAPGGQLGHEYGHGIVDPYRAVTEPLPGGRPSPLGGVAPAPVDPVAQEWSRRWHWVSVIALSIAGLTVCVLILLWAGAAITPRGQRRGWRPTRAPAPVTPAGPEPPDDEQLFAVPKPHG